MAKTCTRLSHVQHLSLHRNKNGIEMLLFRYIVEKHFKYSNILTDSNWEKRASGKCLPVYQTSFKKNDQIYLH